MTFFFVFKPSTTETNYKMSKNKKKIQNESFWKFDNSKIVAINLQKNHEKFIHFMISIFMRQHSTLQKAKNFEKSKKLKSEKVKWKQTVAKSFGAENYF